MKLSQRNMNRGDINYEIYGEFICEIEQEFYCIPVSIKKGKQIILCPHCHELHRHGVGFGRRAAHCEGAYKQSSLGYTIVPSFDTQCITKYKLKKELGGI